MTEKQVLASVCTIRCGEATGLGCGEPVDLVNVTDVDEDLPGYRCVDCKTAFCLACIREHFRRTTKGGS